MFHVPEKFRLKAAGPWSSTADFGNNGAFVIRSIKLKQPLRVIASDGEERKPILGWEGLYEVSTLGKVFSLPKDVPIPNGAVRSHEYHPLSEEVISKGYRRVSLCRDGKIKKVLLHVLVARTFIDNPDPERFSQVNHRDGDKGNCHVENLEWCTPEYNQHHAIERGLRLGLTAEDIEEVKSLLESGLSTTRVADQIGKTRQTIADIKFGRYRNLNPDEPLRWQGMRHWEHVSVSLADRTPTWDEMCLVKRLFWDPEDCVIQFHPPESDYVNLHPYCLHLWRPIGVPIALPPPLLVGPMTADRASC